MRSPRIRAPPSRFRSGSRSRRTAGASRSGARPAPVVGPSRTGAAELERPRHGVRCWGMTTATTAARLLNPARLDDDRFDPATRRLLRATVDWFEAKGKQRLLAE